MTIPTNQLLRKKLRLSEVAQREHVVPRTILRWLEHREKSGFPQPVTIFGRHYFYEDEVAAWEEASPNFGPVKKQACESFVSTRTLAGAFADPGRMRKRDEGLPPPGSGDADVTLHHGVRGSSGVLIS